MTNIINSLSWTEYIYKPIINNNEKISVHFKYEYIMEN